jgi:hypothetical protein
MGFLPQIDKPKIQENGLIVGALFECPPVYGNRQIGATGPGVDDAQIAQRGNIVRFLAKNGLESSLRSLIVFHRESLGRAVEDYPGRFGRLQKECAQTKIRGTLHT